MKRALLVLASLLVSVGFAEGAARVFAPGAPVLPSRRGAFVSPGDHPSHTTEYDVTVHVNRQGWVDREWDTKSGPRTVVLGDSFIQAAQVPLAAGFGRMLDGILPGDVLSMGEPGAGTAMELDNLSEALELQPDLVLLGFLSANDVLNNHPLLEEKTDKAFYTLQDGKLVHILPTEVVQPPGWWRHSALLSTYMQARANKRLAAEKIRLGGGVPIDYRLFDPNGGKVWEEAWTVTEALLREMALRCDRAGVRFGILVFPDGVTATESGRRRMVDAWPAAKGWDVVKPHARAVAMAEAIAPTLDLLPTLRGHDEAYLVKDGHWTAAGHALAAEAVGAWALSEPSLPFASRQNVFGAPPRGITPSTSRAEP